MEGERVPRVEKLEIRTRLCAIVGLGSGTYGIMKRLMGDDTSPYELFVVSCPLEQGLEIFVGVPSFRFQFRASGYIMRLNRTSV